MKNFGRAAATILFPALLLAAGCANKYGRDHVSANRGACERLVVAVMPFQGVSESPGSGLIVADVLANELYALGGFILVTPEVLAARAAPREGEVLSPEEMGRMVGARYILTGRVTEYTYKSGVGEQPAVGITARLIESATGRVLWSATRARTGSAAWFQEDSLGLLTSRICRDMALSIRGVAKEYSFGKPEDDFYMEQHPVITAKPKTGDGNAAGRNGAAATAATASMPAAPPPANRGAAERAAESSSSATSVPAAIAPVGNGR